MFTMMELFAGIGGFRIGFERAGFKTVYANDFDKRCKLVYDNYFGDGAMDLRDIKTIDPRDLPDADIITGGFPCQPFSKIGKLHGFSDARGTLIWYIANIIRAKNPRAFVLENVAHLLKHDGGYTFKRIMETLNDLGYTVHFDVLNTKHYGLPQDRKRVYIVGFRERVDFSFPERLPLKKTVGDLLERSEIHDYYYLSERYLSGLKAHKERHRERGHGFGYKVLDPEGISTALVVGNMGRERNLIKDTVKPESAVNRKGMPLNREGIRKLTVRECARLQGFPDEYSFEVPVTVGYRMMGNAVSVPVAEAVARTVKSSLLDAGVTGVADKDIIADRVNNGLEISV